MARPRRGFAAHSDRRRRLIRGLIPALLLLASCASVTPPSEPPAAPREFRGAWVASVANIDWPSLRDLTTDQQRAEIVAIVERAKKLNLNALIVQMRPSADALYFSPLEPWSEYLTGEQGRAPQPWYDPLQVWIDEAHRRGIELHAWFNPYRARMSRAQSYEAESHIARTRPDLVKLYGDQLWLDPGEPDAAQRTIDVIVDVVRRYDIDGVHIDDYFYPYPVKPPGAAAEIDFPDESSYLVYRMAGGALEKADWRRKNVNDLVQRIHAEVHKEKSWVRFGVSPFGLGKPARRAPGVEGFSQYDKLYADVELWMASCWMDYLVPQLYWPSADPARPFTVLLDGWIRENTCGRHVYVGLFTSRIDATEKSWKPEDIVGQVDLTRARPDAPGHVHFSMAALMQNRQGIADALQARYASPALPPAYPWISSAPPAAPVVTATRSATGVTLTVSAPGATRLAIWTRTSGAWRFAVFPATSSPIDLGPADRIVVSAIDRLNNESARVSP
jgi:uncharacterized lipoprotein YddW (UPF0748 family)